MNPNRRLTSYGPIIIMRALGPSRHLSRSLSKPSPTKAGPCRLPHPYHANSPKQALTQWTRHFHVTARIQHSSGPELVGQNLSQPDSLFACTSTRWLINEEHELQQRYVTFDFDELCRTAARQVSDTAKCVRVSKWDGNSNKAFTLTMDDSSEVIAKLPCQNAGPRVLTTESEVATMRFLESKTSIPVPHVFAWSSDAANPVGAEYIIMEKMPGVPLNETWDAMSMEDRHKIIDQVLQFEKELCGICFPAYGALYLRGALPASVRQDLLPADVDREARFCIGPSCRRYWWEGGYGNMWDQVLSQKFGPWEYLLEYALATTQRETARIANSPTSVQKELSKFDTSQLPDEYKTLLEKLRKALPALSQHPAVLDVAHPALWHTDLHPGNIFVSPSTQTQITGIIDWQSAHIAPLFTQTRFPSFLAPPKGYKSGPDQPALPDNFEALSADEQGEAKREHERAVLSKYYELSVRRENELVFDAVSLTRWLWEPFVIAQLGDLGSLVPLRECLTRLSEGWSSSLGLEGTCPYEPPAAYAERARHAVQKEKFENLELLWDLARTGLLTNEAGWVPRERWEATLKVNRELYTVFMEAMSGEMDAEAARRLWPFPPPPTE
ncbi:kinase-like domain-containing protein, partial [Aspergillus pseudoustus]